jgi:hypothetical protein
LQVQHLRVLATDIGVEYPEDERLLPDLRDTYGWLSQHHEEAITAFTELRLEEERLWLNVSDTVRDDWRWVKATDIVFNGRDDGGRWEAQRTLLPYEKLLCALGARTVRSVTPPPLELLSEGQQLGALRRAVQELREKRCLTDVVIRGLDGQEFSAHRLMLAAASEHFKTEFTGSFSESRAASVEEPVQIDTGFASKAVKAVIGKSTMIARQRRPADHTNRLHL